MESYHCMGFNTNGLLKKIIRQPSKWKSSSGTLHVLGKGGTCGGVAH